MLMSIEVLKKHIERKRNFGQNEHEIMRSLMRAGWDHHDIKTAMGLLNQSLEETSLKAEKQHDAWIGLILYRIIIMVLIGIIIILGLCIVGDTCEGLQELL